MIRRQKFISNTNPTDVIGNMLLGFDKNSSFLNRTNNYSVIKLLKRMNKVAHDTSCEATKLKAEYIVTLLETIKNPDTILTETQRYNIYTSLCEQEKNSMSN